MGENKQSKDRPDDCDVCGNWVASYAHLQECPKRGRRSREALVARIETALASAVSEAHGQCTPGHSTDEQQCWACDQFLLPIRAALSGQSS